MLRDSPTFSLDISGFIGFKERCPGGPKIRFWDLSNKGTSVTMLQMVCRTVWMKSFIGLGQP